MFDWISHNKELFLQSHTEIGRSYQHAVELQTQHNHFTMNSMVTTVLALTHNHSGAVRLFSPLLMHNIPSINLPLM